MEWTCVDTSLNLNVSPSGRMDDDVLLVEELHRLSNENKRLTERLTRMSESYSALQKHLSEVLLLSNNTTNIINSETETDLSTSTTQIWKKNKRKAETNVFSFSGGSECSTSIGTEDECFKRPKDHNHTPNTTTTPPPTSKVSKVLVRTQASDPSLYVRDGYQWRKYGQKVTRDNPSPRAYFRCSHAPTCPVKKKVQRSVEDPTVLVATYEGEHNHEMKGIMRTEISVASVGAESCIMNENGLDQVQRSGLVRHNINGHNNIQFLVQQMASSLTKDPIFTSALASAISHTSPHN